MCEEKSEIVKAASAEKWWRQKLVDGHLLPDCSWAKLTRVAELVEDYDKVMGRVGRDLSGRMDALEKLFDRVLPSLPMANLEIDGPGRWTMCYRFPDLDTCRESFDAVCGEQEWSPKAIDDLGGKR